MRLAKRKVQWKLVKSRLNTHLAAVISHSLNIFARLKAHYPHSLHTCVGSFFYFGATGSREIFILLTGLLFQYREQYNL